MSIIELSKRDWNYVEQRKLGCPCCSDSTSSVVVVDSWSWLPCPAPYCWCCCWCCWCCWSAAAACVCYLAWLDWLVTGVRPGANKYQTISLTKLQSGQHSPLWPHCTGDDCQHGCLSSILLLCFTSFSLFCFFLSQPQALTQLEVSDLRTELVGRIWLSDSSPLSSD